MKLFFKKKLFYFLSFFSCISIVSVAVFLYLFAGLPKLDSLEDYNPPQKSMLYDKYENLIAEFFTQKRTVIDIEELPNHVTLAFLAAEDSDFYSHDGIDYTGLLRALLTEIKRAFLGGKRIGGSTITQQTAKAMLLSNEQSYKRKIREIILTKRIEDRLSKDEILQIYLNQIYFGHGVYGIEEAAKIYYGISATDLSISQAATLASIPKSPNKINPISNPKRVQTRRNYVLEQMLINQFASAFEINQAKNESIISVSKNLKYLNKAPYFTESVRKKLLNNFGYTQLYEGGLRIYSSVNIELQLSAQKAIRKGLEDLDKRQGYKGPIKRFDIDKLREITVKLNLAKKDIFSLPNQTLMVWDLRNFLMSKPAKNFKKAVKKISKITLIKGQHLIAQVKKIYDDYSFILVDLGSTDAILPFNTMLWARKYNPKRTTKAPKKPSDVLAVGDFIEVTITKTKQPVNVSLKQKPTAQGALIAINPDNNEVVAMVGGYDFSDSKFNRATQAKRQPGSSIKPLIYATAIDSELVTASSLISDVPKVYFEPKQEGKWKPKNHTEKYLGDITLRKCLLSSVNTCSISLLEMIGTKPVLKLATALNLNTKKSPFPKDLTLALGSPDVVPLNFVNAFTIFPNMGKFALPVLITKVKSSTGQILFQNIVERENVLRPEAAYIITNMLKSYMTKGPGRRLGKLKHNLAGKTGTSNDWRNAWFVGFSPKLVAGVYVGNDNNTSLGKAEYGVKAAMPIWGNFMKEALYNKPISNFVQPKGIVWRVVEERTGLLAEERTPQDYKMGTELDDFNNMSTQRLPQGTVLEAFIEGTEPTLTAQESPPPPMELFELETL